MNGISIGLLVKNDYNFLIKKDFYDIIMNGVIVNEWTVETWHHSLLV